MALEVCPCVFCQSDHAKKLPLAVATWTRDGKYWAPWRDKRGDGFVTSLESSSAFGPRHANEIRKNYYFTVTLLTQDQQARIS